MMRALNTAVSGLSNFQQKMDTIGNDVANVNTWGYKSSRTEFADTFSQTLRTSSGGGAVTSGSSSMQVGSGVTTSSIRNLFTQGSVTRTDIATDLSVQGDGFFVVRDPLTGGTFATRAGNFKVDTNGYLVTEGGQRVQGYNNRELSSIGDIRIDKTGTTTTDANEVSSFGFDADGKLTVTLDNSDKFVRGQILLQRFRDPQALIKEGASLYSGFSAAGPLGGGATPTPAAPGTSGLGKIIPGSLELSNVDLTNEFSDLITTQRAFQATARLMTTSDDMLQEIVNLKR